VHGPGAVHDAEVMTVGPDEVVVTFVTDPGVEVVTRVGDREVTTTGPNHLARVTELTPATTYDVEVEGVAHDAYLPSQVTTLEVPPGPLLATVATVNDVHFGEVECGRVGDVDPEALGPVLRSAPGELPYPEIMNRAAIAEIEAVAPDAVIAKGDLTNLGTEDEYGAFLDAYGRLGPHLHHVRGNHDAMIDPALAVQDAPYAVELGGVTLAVIDTVIPGLERGRVGSEQLAWLDDLGRNATGPVLVFGHDHCWNVESSDRNPTYFGIAPDDSERLVDVVARHEPIVGYFAGHTHRNRVRRFTRTGAVPFVEIGATKDYPGCWAEYRVHAGGYTQIVRRIASPDALAWTERTRPMFAGLYRDYALGSLAARGFTLRF
jgi:3',5'-cyclic-AMP phosphodiesterase